MPYRRLPNTDQARIKALSIAVEKGDTYNPVISLKTLSEARRFLPRFKTAQIYYKQCFDNQVSTNRKFQVNARNARLYISHFIQVLNLAVIRSEIKEEYKDLYELPRDTNNVPDLTSEASVLEWGERIIKGERERMRLGGIPIYNPTIAKVTVHYDIFKEGYECQKNRQLITSRSLNSLAAMREYTDEIILDIWNQIERHFESLPREERLNKCREYGLVYYYRSGEVKPK